MAPSRPESEDSGRRDARVCINLHSETHESLRAIALREGRSLSNLCAHLLEQMLEQLQEER